MCAHTWQGVEGCAFGPDWIDRAWAFFSASLEPPTSYFLSIQEEGDEKNSRKELVCVECTSSDNTHTQIPELIVPSKGQKKKNPLSLVQ